MNGVLPSFVDPLSEKYFCRGKFEEKRTNRGLGGKQDEKKQQQEVKWWQCPDNTYHRLKDVV